MPARMRKADRECGKWISHSSCCWDLVGKLLLQDGNSVIRTCWSRAGEKDQTEIIVFTSSTQEVFWSGLIPVRNSH